MELTLDLVRADIEKRSFDMALSYAVKYVHSEDPFIRRWGYVMFISKLCAGHAGELLTLIKDDEAYYVQMGEAWLIAVLAIYEPEKVHCWMEHNGLKYSVNGKAIQKICDSYRISDEWKARFKQLRSAIKQN